MKDPKKPKVLGRKQVFTGEKVRVHEVDLQFVDNRVTFELIDFEVETGVTALPILDGELVLIRHYQVGIDDIGYSLPSGGLAFGEDPEKRMQLELQEEIGYKAEKLTLMMRPHVMPGYIGTSPTYIFLAEDLVPSSLPGDEDYEIQIVKLKLSSALEMVRAGDIVDGRTTLALLYYDKFLSD